MTKENFFEALKNATKGTFEQVGTKTLMGWEQEYDEKGRPLRSDPNYLDYDIKIDGVRYSITKKGWMVYVWKPKYYGKAHYGWLWSEERKEEGLLYEYDTTPEYVKEYYEKNESSRKTE